MASAVPTYEEFVTVYPVFLEVAEGIVQEHLDESALLLNAAAWGDFYGRAVSLDAAHNLAMTQQTGSSINSAIQAAAGPISGTSGAGVSVSFSAPPWTGKSSADWYNRTVFGQQFLRLRGVVIPAGGLSV